MNAIENHGYLSIFGGKFASSSIKKTATVLSSDSSITIIGTHFLGFDYSTQVNLTNKFYKWLPNTQQIEFNGHIMANGYVSAPNGFTGRGSNVTVTSLNTWTKLNLGPIGGMVVFRDSSAGGTALYIMDSTKGPVEVKNGIEGFEIRWNTANDYEIRITADTQGHLPRTIVFTQVVTNFN